MLSPGFVGFIFVPSLPTSLCFLLGFFHSHYSSFLALPVIKGEHSLLNSVLNVDFYRRNPFSTIASHFPCTLTLSSAFLLHTEQLFRHALQKDARGLTVILKCVVQIILAKHHYISPRLNPSSSSSSLSKYFREYDTVSKGKEEQKFPFQWFDIGFGFVGGVFLMWWCCCCFKGTHLFIW